MYGFVKRGLAADFKTCTNNHSYKFNISDYKAIKGSTKNEPLHRLASLKYKYLQHQECLRTEVCVRR